MQMATTRPLLDDANLYMRGLGPFPRPNAPGSGRARIYDTRATRVRGKSAIQSERDGSRISAATRYAP
jgi:hypothetical protein